MNRMTVKVSRKNWKLLNQIKYTKYDDNVTMDQVITDLLKIAEA